MANERKAANSGLFFFMKPTLDLGKGQGVVDVDRVTSCYIDSVVVPRLHLSRINQSHVVVRRSDGGLDKRLVLN